MNSFTAVVDKKSTASKRLMSTKDMNAQVYQSVNQKFLMWPKQQAAATRTTG